MVTLKRRPLFVDNVLSVVFKEKNEGNPDSIIRNLNSHP